MDNTTTEKSSDGKTVLVTLSPFTTTVGIVMFSAGWFMLGFMCKVVLDNSVKQLSKLSIFDDKKPSDVPTVEVVT